MTDYPAPEPDPEATANNDRSEAPTRHLWGACNTCSKNVFGPCAASAWVHHAHDAKPNEYYCNEECREAQYPPEAPEATADEGKPCSKCGEPMPGFYFYNAPTDGVMCEPCFNVAQQEATANKESSDEHSKCFYCGDECPAPRRFVNLGGGFCTDSCAHAWDEKRPASPLSQHPDASPTPSAPISPLRYITANALGFLEGTVVTALRRGDLLVAREHIELMITEEES